MMDGLAPAPAPEDDRVARLALAAGGVAMVAGAVPQLWHRAVGEGYADERRVPGTLLAVDCGVRLRFSLPAATAIAFVRLRLPAIAGCYRVESLALAGVAVDALARRAMHAGGQRLPCARADAVRIASAEQAPTLEIDLRGLPGLDAASVPELEVRIVREDVPTAGHAQATAAIAGLSTDVLALLHAQGDDAFSSARRQRQSDRMLRTATDAHAREVTAALAALGTRFGAELASRADRHGAALAAIDEGLASRFADLRPGLDGLRDALRAQAEAMANLVEDTRALRAEVDAIGPQVAALRNSVDNVFWRRWLRRLRGALR